MGPHDLLLGLLSPAGRVDPYPYYRDLIERWPVLPITRERLLVTGYQECVDVLVNPRLYPVPDRHCADRLWPAWRTFPSTDLLYRSLLFRNAPDNQPARRLLARFFGPGEVARMRPMITRHAEAGTAPFGTAHAVVDAARTFTTIPNGVMGELLGLPRHDEEMLAGWVNSFLERNELHPPDKALAVADEAATRLVEHLDATAGGDAPLVRTLAGHGRLGAGDLMSNLVFLLGAGTVTTGSLLGTGVRRLAACNDLLPRLREDDALLRSFVQETLRYDPPIQYGVRVAAEDTELAGVPLPRDSVVLVSFGALGRDPARFADPDVFVADRFDTPEPAVRDVLSFGLGAHRCAGAELALVTSEIAFRHLAARVDAITEAGMPERQARAVTRSYTELAVEVVPVDRSFPEGATTVR
ncbi:cytochrome P450 [Lentzea sp. HUAS12]|uniref:cytochrome P450 n=1 Tax=Lentzea sp. HUAS12 TaxID=2951806 RepID=UPI00209DD94F|nr:cytochrome P450 [Lentzea sp. HUAS12]USX55484.1 cytochrome P450 [Lentzea sp. HUAS12]